MKKLFVISALLGALLFTSCEGFLDINYTQDSPVTTSVDQVLPVATFYASQLCYDHAEYGVYMCQALTTSGKSSTGSYPYSQGWEFLGVNRHPMWRRHFYDLGSNLLMMNQIAGYDYNATTGEYEMNWNLPTDEDKRIPRPNAVLIGRTIMLMSTMMTTDAFGDMPRSQAYQSTSPRYDSQAEVYEWLFREADELVKLYQDTTWTKCRTNLIINEKMDRIYAGDLAKWECFCKALRARLWLRKLPNWDNTKPNCEKIIAMVDDVLNDADWQEPRYYYPGGVTESNCPWGPYAPKINSWESRDNRLDESIPTTFFLHAILGSIDGNYESTRGHALDPRATRLMEARTTAEGTNMAMRHLESNIGWNQDDKITNFPDLLTTSRLSNPYTQNTGYIALITEEELKFIKAEAQYWAGLITEAYNTTVEATIDNMARYGIVESALKDDDPELYDGGPLDQYHRFFNIKLPGAGKFTLADLMQQKYVAMYLQPEQWIDMRRYNYSSSNNGISYVSPVPGKQPVYVYDVKNVHNGGAKKFAQDSANFNVTYALQRPFNLYAAYWVDDPDNYGKNAKLSPNAWVARLNADTETETKYNKNELDRMGYYTTNAAGEKILDYHILKRRMIWAYNTCGMAISADPDIEWQ